MRIINKKYLLIILLVGVILTGVIILKPKENIQLDNVILKQEVNNKTFAMYKEDGEGYTKVEENKFPEMYVLNLTKSKCIDNNGNELDGVLSYENDKVVIEGSSTTYCYLYFDKSLGEEIKEKKPSGLSVDIKGAMYRFQGQAKDENGHELVNNYICFGTSDKDTCKGNTDRYMYRIIGIEATTGRVKVIKKEALDKTLNWWDNYNEDIEFPKSNIYNAINGNDFLKNLDYVPKGWEDKISNNNWLYGNMLEAGLMGANQTGEELYKIETGQKETQWYVKSTLEEGGYPFKVDWSSNIEYYGQTLYYKILQGIWTDTKDAKISLMYLHDYYLSVGDNINCQYTAGEEFYSKCKLGWMYINNNEDSESGKSEFAMGREGWDRSAGLYLIFAISSSYGSSFMVRQDAPYYARPVFYINALEELLDGKGTITDPFIIKS